MDEEKPLEDFGSVVVAVGLVAGEGELVVGVVVLLKVDFRSRDDEVGQQTTAQRQEQARGDKRRRAAVSNTLKSLRLGSTKAGIRPLGLILRNRGKAFVSVQSFDRRRVRQSCRTNSMNQGSFCVFLEMSILWVVYLKPG